MKQVSSVQILTAYVLYRVPNNNGYEERRENFRTLDELFNYILATRGHHLAQQIIIEGLDTEQQPVVLQLAFQALRMVNELSEEDEILGKG